MVLRLILTVVVVSSITGCMPEHTEGVHREEQNSGQAKNPETSQDENAEELYLPGQD
jgi:hypothetical protein